jgi:hypothetical protein
MDAERILQRSRIATADSPSYALQKLRATAGMRLVCWPRSVSANVCNNSLAS